jgi:uncharacterized PurR-regulated membrane protein YhhQ (DUF165 family)
MSWLPSLNDALTLALAVLVLCSVTVVLISCILAIFVISRWRKKRAMYWWLR